MAKHLDLGVNGEELAEQYLARQGLKIIDRRVRYKRGEIDLVARDGEEWVFIEVKTRKSVSSGLAAEALSPAKAKRLRKAVELYIYENNLEGAVIRFDFLAIDVEPGGVPEITHFPGEIPWED